MKARKGLVPKKDRIVIPEDLLLPLPGWERVRLGVVRKTPGSDYLSVPIKHPLSGRTIMTPVESYRPFCTFLDPSEMLDQLSEMANGRWLASYPRSNIRRKSESYAIYEPFGQKGRSLFKVSLFFENVDDATMFRLVNAENIISDEQFAELGITYNPWLNL